MKTISTSLGCALVMCSLTKALGVQRKSESLRSGADSMKNCCFQNTLIRVQPIGCTSEYLHFYFLFTAQSERFVSSTQGVNIHHIGKNGLATFQIPVPPLPEQQRIVAKIDKVSSNSARARDHLDHLPLLVKKYKEAVLATAFRGHPRPRATKSAEIS